MYFIFMVRLLDDGRETTVEIEVARIDCEWPTHKIALQQAEMLVRDCGAWFDFARIRAGS
jgi:hypothetical protein